MLQTALKLLVGHEEELLRIIPILLGCKMENVVEGNFIEITSVQNLRSLMKETAYSHLMEVRFIDRLNCNLFIYLLFDGFEVCFLQGRFLFHCLKDSIYFVFVSA